MPGFTPRHENEIRWFPSSCLGTDAHEAHSGALVDAMLRMLPSPGALIPDELMKALHECGLAVRTKDSEKESTGSTGGRGDVCFFRPSGGQHRHVSHFTVGVG
jgi:hypothetical protein